MDFLIGSLPKGAHGPGHGAQLPRSLRGGLAAARGVRGDAAESLNKFKETLVNKKTNSAEAKKRHFEMTFCSAEKTLKLLRVFLTSNVTVF